ncbi:Unknown protein sequence [Pseudomonas savastanoi pv. phaseolicola]|nr:Unknown protein sequence [Pseudomonas amygdali pv. mellea]KPB67330.1 Unknown protein sequence [Pseudomonas savastanoi pv. phaseolicola]
MRFLPFPELLNISKEMRNGSHENHSQDNGQQDRPGERHKRFRAPT